MYHALGTDRIDADHAPPVAPTAFERQVRWLREAGFTAVSIGEAAATLGRGMDDGTCVAITFDNGYLDTLTTAAPILQRYGLPFTVFVVGSYVRRPPAAGRYLDAVALRELAAVPGVTIGAHGNTHRPLTRLQAGDLADELGASATAIADAIGARPVAMSYPHGAVDARVARSAGEAGFTVGATSLLGVNRCGVPLLRLRRTEVTGADDDASFRGKIRGDYDWYQLKQRLYWPVPAA